MSELNDLQERLDISEAKNILNNWVAISVAIISVFMAVSKVKDDNIVQAMLQAKSDAVDTASSGAFSTFFFVGILET